MYDNTRALGQHGRQKSPVQSHRWKEIEVKRLVPFLVIKFDKSAAWRRRTTYDVNHNVDAAQLLGNGGGHAGAALGTGDIGGDEKFR